MSNVTRRHRHLKRGHESLLLPTGENVSDGHPSAGRSIYIGSTPLPPRPTPNAHRAGSSQGPTLPPEPSLSIRPTQSHSDPSQPTQSPSDPSHPTQSPDDPSQPTQTQSDPSQPTQSQSDPLQSDREASVNVSFSGSEISEGRQLVYLSEMTLQPSEKVAELTTEKCFKQEIQEGGFYWSLLSDETIEKYWDWFKRHVHWNGNESEDAVKEAWKKKASTCYSVYISRAKKIYHEKKQVKEGISSSNIKIFESYWNRDDTKAESERNRRNRGSVSRATWTGGSKSTRKWINTMRQKGLPTDPISVGRYLHTRKHDGTNFVNPKAKNVNDTCEELRQKASEDSSGSETWDPNEAYLTAIGGGPDHRNRLFGLGNGGHIFYGDGAYSRKSTRSFLGTDHLLRENVELRKRVQKNEDDIELYKRATDAALKAADVAAKNADEVRKMFQQVLPFLPIQSVNNMQGGAGPSHFSMPPVHPSYFGMPPFNGQPFMGSFGFASTSHNMQDLLNSQNRRPIENEEVGEENTNGSRS